MPSERATRALIAHSQAGGAEGENADRLLGALTPYSPFMQNALALIEDASDIEGLRDVVATATALQAGAKARGMGIEAENMAAEVVVRAERAIGQAIITLKGTGMLYMGGSEFREEVGRKALALREKRARERLAMGKVLSSSDERIRLADFSVTPNESMNFQRLAQAPADQFESLVTQFRSSGKRLAKANFYALTKPAGAVVDPLVAPVSDRTTSPYSAFDKAARVLIDGMAQLPDDELRACATIIRDLVTAYQRAKAERTAR